jgi:outer membrane murein-binding lipoprotein Lpp
LLQENSYQEVTMFAALTARGITIIGAVVLATALFAISGCSTLGIATTKETEAMQAWQDSLGQVVYTMNARLANLDSVEAELKRMEAMIATSEANVARQRQI